METTHTRADPAASSPRPRLRRPVPLVVYIVGLVALFFIVAGADVGYQRQAAGADARQEASASAGFRGASTAAHEIAAALSAARTQVAILAAGPRSARLRACRGHGMHPAVRRVRCVQHRARGHRRADGTVTCSSLAAAKVARYASCTVAGRRAQSPGTHRAGVVDARTGQQVVLVTAPVPGEGPSRRLPESGPARAGGSPRRWPGLVTLSS